MLNQYARNPLLTSTTNHSEFITDLHLKDTAIG